MTTSTHDWKVTGAHRVLVGLGWLLATAACFFAGAAIVLRQPELWGPAAALAFVALGIGLTLPEPVPHDMLSERRSVMRATP